MQEVFTQSVVKDRERPGDSSNTIHTKYNVFDINFSYSKGYNENMSFERDQQDQP